MNKKSPISLSQANCSFSALPIDGSENLEHTPLQVSRQLPVLNQHDTIGAGYSSGFHAIKNALLGLLLIAQRISEARYITLAQNDFFYETLYRALSPEPTNHEYYLNRQEVEQKIDELLHSGPRLDRFGITPELLAAVDEQQLTIAALSTSVNDEDCDEKDHHDINGVFIVENPIENDSQTHWVTLTVMQTQGAYRQLIYTDSFDNQPSYINTVIHYVNSLLSNYRQGSLN